MEVGKRILTGDEFAESILELNNVTSAGRVLPVTVEQHDTGLWYPLDNAQMVPCDVGFISNLLEKVHFLDSCIYCNCPFGTLPPGEMYLYIHVSR